MNCNRCAPLDGRKIKVLTGSMFNTEMICHLCREAEEKHPEFKRAVAVELAEVRKGNMNYAGIGLPADLIGGGHE